MEGLQEMWCPSGQTDMNVCVCILRNTQQRPVPNQDQEGCVICPVALTHSHLCAHMPQCSPPHQSPKERVLFSRSYLVVE